MNIHVLPTDKPSRLYLVKDRLKLSPLKFTNDKEIGWFTQNIYITSDEEIKEGDFFIGLKNQISRATNKDIYGGFEKKIILTTNQYLIKDGVQAIDDEFLKWFVKNPSCEEVEVAKTNKLIDNYADNDDDRWEVKYIIYIPKEEPKQETLEEASLKYSELNQYDLAYHDEGGYQGIDEKVFAKKLVDFTTKWQAERIYSEFETKTMLVKLRYDILINGDVDLEEWFEQFKKK